MAYLPPNPKRVGYIVPIHGPLDGPLYMGSIYTNRQVAIHSRSLIDLSYFNTRQMLL